MKNKTMLSSLLFGFEAPSRAGRLVKFGDIEPDITCVADIAKAIGSDAGRVTKTVRALVTFGRIAAIKTDGTRTEYALVE